ncbi:MAG: hypothetical protein ABEL51_05010 [Salinibacter sp.]
MTILYLANVGTRDVTRNGKTTDQPRVDGQKWLDAYEAIEATLDAPILLPGLQHVLQWTDSVEAVLFYTDQQETAPDFAPRDTIPFAQILTRLLPERLGTEALAVRPVRLDGNPADHDAMIEFFANRLRDLLDPESVEAAYVAPVGGADAANMGLLINAIRVFRERCQAIYVTPDGAIHPLNLHRNLLTDYAQHEAQAHLARHDYAALRSTLERAQLGEPWHRHLCDYADRRLRFDFQEAATALRTAQDRVQDGETRLKLSRISESLEPLLEEPTPPTSDDTAAEWTAWLQRQRRLLQELHFNLWLKAAQGEWVDFLGRLFRMDEALLRLAFEQETRHATEGSRSRGYPDFAQAVATDPGLRELNFKREPTRYALTQIVDYWVREGGQPNYGPLIGCHRQIDGLSQLRNKSIIAHGYRGVSRDDIRDHLGKDDLDQLQSRLEGALEALGVSIASDGDPYAVVQELLRQELT